MSSLSLYEKEKLESILQMGKGFLLDFTNAKFADFFLDFGIDIYSDQFASKGSSKANRMRRFWEIESDQVVGDVMREILKFANPRDIAADLQIEVIGILERLERNTVQIGQLKSTAQKFNLQYMNRQIERMNSAIDGDPDLAIGTAKELVETCCKTILIERRIAFDEKQDDLPKLVKTTLVELDLVPNAIRDAAAGSGTIKRILSNLSSVLQGIGELRNNYGTGHGKHGKSKGLASRHARLVVGSASTIVHFILETHVERQPK